MPASSVSSEIKHLMGAKAYPQKRAVAASMSMARAGQFGKKAKRSAGLKRLYKEG